MQLLRPHQELAIEMLRDSIKQGKKRPILAAPTSFGKTTVASAMIKSAIEKGKRCAFIVDRVQLVDQAAERFIADGLEVGVMQADHPLTNPKAPVQVCSVQTLSRRPLRLDVDFIMIDEAHCCYKFHQTIMKAYNAIPIIGLTATPFSKGLGNHYNNLLVPITTRELIEGGFLKRPEYYQADNPDLHGVKVQKGKGGVIDFKDADVADIMDNGTLVGSIVGHWKKLASDRKTVCFATNVAHSQHIVYEFKKAGISAVHIDGYMNQEQRKEIYDGYDDGTYQIMCCPQLLDTGWDSPATSCLIDARPTKSLIRHVQKIGRVLRLHKDNDTAIILDHAGNTLRHGFAEDIMAFELCDGTKEEKDTVEQQEKKEKEPRECTECHFLHTEFECPKCGFVFIKKEEIQQVEGDLVKADNSIPLKDREEFYQQMKGHSKSKGYKEGWAAMQYKDKFKQWPPHSFTDLPSMLMTEVGEGWIKHKNIKYAMGKKFGKSKLKKAK